MTLSRLTRRQLLALGAALASLTATAAPAPTDTAATPAVPATTATITDFTLGDPAAKLTMAEFLSVTCPHCAHFHGEIYPKLKADYIDTGKIKLEIHEVYRNQLDLYGGLVARCGGQMRYLGVMDLLFDKQKDWAGAADTAGVVEQLKKIGRTAGMTDEQIDACLRDQTVAEALVTHFQADQAKNFPNDSFEGTPTFMLNGVLRKDIFSDIAYADLQAILDAELAK
ncbi:MAG: thioredoxin domain-containing protein [Alphaproteobacteria bacterium]